MEIYKSGDPEPWMNMPLKTVKILRDVRVERYKEERKREDAERKKAEKERESKNFKKMITKK